MINRSVLSISLTLNLIFAGIALLGWVAPNVPTTFNPTVSEPDIAPTARIHPMAVVNGSVTIGQMIFVAPGASIRGDEGQHIFVGDFSNVQDGVVIHGLETFEGDHEMPENEVQVDGKNYSVYIGKRVSLAHQSQIHGPAKVGDDTFVGMQALVFRAELGDHVVVEPGAKLIGVNVPSGRYVPALTLVTTQAQADALPVVTASYIYRNLNEGVVRVNVQLANAGQPQQINR
ncbi:MAG TPA: carbonic anhydrase [Nitrospira sp.]|jgi:carbonic anhydrase/acetyltransferase-like protein (isoleucine patch superfamily)|nr:carbonic anhydrase [Nitrospira sp.]